VRLNSKGQVTIPAQLRRKHGLEEGDEVEVVDDGDKLTIVRASGGRSRGERLVTHMRGRATTNMSTDELMGLLRDD
jgi:AbrB family looped-hinge helix DNA binding protein